jgi:hypothetical protein
MQREITASLTRSIVVCCDFAFSQAFSAAGFSWSRYL